MEQFDEPPYDIEELSPEELFTSFFLDLKNNRKIKVALVDEDGDTVEISEIVSQIVKYNTTKLNEEIDDPNNQIVNQIMPLMAQSIASGLGRLIGNWNTGYIISNPALRTAIINMMMVAFSMYRIMNKNNLKIQTTIEQLEPEEVERIYRKSTAASAAVSAAGLGANPREILQNLLENGFITQEDLDELSGGNRGDN